MAKWSVVGLCGRYRILPYSVICKQAVGSMELFSAFIMQECFQCFSCSGAVHQISIYASLTECFCADKQNLRFSACVLGKGFREVSTAGIADYDEFLRHIQIPLQQILTALKITLAAFIKYKEIGAGIIAVIW